MQWLAEICVRRPVFASVIVLVFVVVGVLGYTRLQVDAKSKLLERYAVTDASMHDSQQLAELVATEDGEVYADSADRSAAAEALLAQKQSIVV